MTQQRKIEGAVLQSGRIYKAGDEDALALLLPQPDIDRLVAKGVLSGPWSSAPAPAEPGSGAVAAAAPDSISAPHGTTPKAPAAATPSARPRKPAAKKAAAKKPTKKGRSK